MIIKIKRLINVSLHTHVASIEKFQSLVPENYENMLSNKILLSVLF